MNMISKSLDEMTLPLEVGQFYHIYNRGNNKEHIFFREENYLFFLKKYNQYLSDYVDTYAFCLLPNHFHLLIKVKDEKALRDVDYSNVPMIVGNQFRLFFMSYAKAINIQEGREGSLFRKIFRRKRIDNDSYLMSLICYINSNAVKHGLSSKVGNYKWSSYQIMVSDKTTNLKREEILGLFEGRDEFIDAVKSKVLELKSEKYWMEE